MNNEELRDILKATILKKPGIPKHLRGLAKEIAEELIKEGSLLAKSTSYGLEVSLNPRRKAEIDKIIKKIFSLQTSRTLSTIPSGFICLRCYFEYLARSILDNICLRKLKWKYYDSKVIYLNINKKINLKF